MVQERQYFIVPSKISVPRLPANVVERRRLEQRFVESYDNTKLIMLTAPAGCGKSTASLHGYYAVAQERPETQLAWVSLDPEDSDPHAFAAYLVSSIAKVVSLSGDICYAAVHDHNMVLRALISQLLVELEESETELMLVIDDFHVIDNDEVHQALAFLIKHLPDSVHVVITSRTEAPPVLTALRLQGLVVEFNQQDLAFTEEEAQTFVRHVLNRDFEEFEIKQLVQRIEGWAVGLQMLMFSLKQNPTKKSPEEHLDENNLSIHDYFQSEVMNHLPEEVQTFMLNTAMVKRFNLEVAEALCPNINCYDVLDQLQRQHLFLVQFSDPAGWYRYHHLLREFLQHQLKIQPPEYLTDLHRKASEVFNRLGYVVGAVDHAIAAGDVLLIMAILRKHGDDLIHKAHYDLVRRCLNQLNRQQIVAEPVFVSLFCWVEAIYGDAKQVAPMLKEAWHLVEGRHGEDRDFLIGEFLTVRAQAHLSLYDHDQAIKDARQALKHYDPHTIRRQSALLILANVYYQQGLITDALGLYEEAEMLSRQEANHDAVLWSLNQQSAIQRAKGSLQQAVNLSREVQNYAREQGVMYGFNVLFAHINQAEALLEEYHLREARQILGNVAHLVRNWDTYWQVHLDGWLLKCEMLKGKVGVARQYAERHEQILSSDINVELLMPYNLEVQVNWWWLNNDVKKIQTWLRTVGEEPVQYSIPGFVRLRARIMGLFAVGDLDRANQYIAEATEKAREQGFRLELVRLLLLRAVSQSLDEYHDQAKATLLNAIPLAAEYQLVASWMLLRQWLLPVLETVDPKELHDEKQVRYVEQIVLLQKQRTTLGGENEEQKNSMPDGLLAMGVSKKEWKVLRHILDGKSNEEIASSMFIAISTVKTHINNLYKKLNVRNRKEAISITRQLLQG